MDHLTVAGKLLSELKVTELKDELGKRQLSKTGNKQQLVARLGEFLLSNPEPHSEVSPEVAIAPPIQKPRADENPLIAQYLAERESLLAESLDHKRKVQAERRPETEFSYEEPEAHDHGFSASGKSPSKAEESVSHAEDASLSPSRRKNRKPEQRKTDMESALEIGASPPRTRSALRSPSPRKEESINMPSPKKEETVRSPSPKKDETLLRSPSPIKENTVVRLPTRAKEELGGSGAITIGEELVPSGTTHSDHSLVQQSREGPVSEGVSRENSSEQKVNVQSQGREDGVEKTGLPVVHVLPPSGNAKTAVTKSTTIAVPTAQIESQPIQTLPDIPAEKPEVSPSRPIASLTLKDSTTSKLRDEGPQKMLQDLEIPVTKEPGMGKTVTKGKVAMNKQKVEDSKEPTPAKPKLSAPVPVDEKPVAPHQRKLTDSMSIEEEKLDYGDLEADDEMTGAKLPELSQSVETSQIKKRRASAERAVPVKGSDEHPKEAREPPRKMARSGLGSISEEAKKVALSTPEQSAQPMSRNPISRMLHIRNLVRPYTVPQLKELLKKTGNIVDDADHFWIDGIKSQCIVMYSTEDEAEATRKALWNCVWPSSNTKTLMVDFIKEEEFKDKTTVPPTTSGAPTRPTETKRTLSTSGPRPHIDRPAVEKLKITVASNKETGEAQRDVAIAREERRIERREKEKEKELELVVKDATDGSAVKATEKIQEREWDRGKQMPDRSDNLKTEEPSKPGTPLELLFQRTEAKPQLYWKPLTDDQVKAREEEDQKVAKDREERKNPVEISKPQDRPRGISRDRRRSPRRESPRRRSRSRNREERGYRGGGGGSRPAYSRRSPYRGRRSPSPSRGYRGRRSRSNSRSRRY